MVTTPSPYWVNHDGRLLHSMAQRTPERRQGMLISQASGNTLASRSPRCCCRSRRFLSLPQPLRWGRCGHCQGSTIGAVCLRYLAVPRLVERTRRECLAVRHSWRPEHLGRSIRTSDTGGLVFCIRRSRTSHTGLCRLQLLDVFEERSAPHEPGKPSTSPLSTKSFVLRTVASPSAATAPGSSVGTTPTTRGKSQ